jgi:hypothetical protein
MGSSITSVGSKGGKPLFTFTAAGQDTGSFMAHIPRAVPGQPIPIIQPGLRECPRWSKWMFQLTGTGTGYAVTMYGTIDEPTARNEAGNGGYWFPLPAPSSETVGDAFAWTNPLTVGTALYVHAILVGVRAVSGVGPITGTVELLAFVEP